MVTDNKAHVFISYARHDGQDIADSIREDLQAKGFTIWHDVVAMRGGENWWLQIKEAIEGCAVMVFVLTQGAIDSSVVTDEWSYARTVGTPILPVTENSDIFSVAPQWISRNDVLILDEAHPNYDLSYQRFINQVNSPPERKPRPFTVPNLPDNFIPREEETEKIIGQLLDKEQTSPIAITTALQGGGGFGKTTLAKAICFDDRIRVAFDDGILWMQFREDMSSGDILNLLNTQIRLLAADETPFTEITVASTRFRDLLADRNILIVLDDVWKESYLRHCIHEDTSYLITTRIEDVVIEADAESTQVDEMSDAQSYALLIQGVDFDDDEETELKPQLDKLAQRCRGWALLLNLINAAYRKQARKRGASRALERILEDLEDEGFSSFDRRNNDERNSALDNSLGVSFNLLEKDDIQSLIEIGIFPEDTAIPLTTLAQLWEITDRQALRLCEDFAELSLFKLNTQDNVIEIHDVVRQLLKARLSDVVAVNQRLLKAWDEYTRLPDDYAWHHIAYHLEESGQTNTLRGLLLNFDYLQNKLNATDVNALIADCDSLPGDKTIRLIKSCLEVSAHVLVEHKETLPFQLRGRLGYHVGDDITAFLKNIPRENLLEPINRAWLNPAGGALLRIFEGHSSSVTDAVQLQDGNILSWSSDKTLRLWQANGSALATLEGHSAAVAGAIQLNDGNILSWADSNRFDIRRNSTLRLWQADGYPITALQGHSESVAGAIQLNDGNILSWSSDKTLRIWHPDGSHIDTLQEHSESVAGAIQLNDGNILSWSSDKTLRIWHPDGTHIDTLEGHSNSVAGAIQLNDGNILSWANSNLFGRGRNTDKSLRLWQADGSPITILEGHSAAVADVIQLHNGNILSWGEDKTLRIWHPDGVPLATLEGHSAAIAGVIQLQDGNILSWSGDSTLRVWHPDGTHIDTLEGHSNSVSGAIQLNDGNILSWAAGSRFRATRENALRLWQADGSTIAILERHSSPISGAIQLNDGNILSWAAGSRFDIRRDSTLRLWQADGYPITALEGHSDDVDGTIQLNDGSILSWGEDKTLRIWHPDGSPIAILEGHSSPVNGALQLRDGNILSWSEDKTLRLWQADGTPIATLNGLSSSVASAIQLRDGNILSWAGGFESEDQTLRIWHPDGSHIATLEGHSNSVAGAIQLRDGNILSWADDYFLDDARDYTLRLWQAGGSPIATLEGHSGGVAGAIQLKDGNILSWSGDSTLRLWQPDGSHIAVLEGHSSSVSRTIQLNDGNILSWSRDSTLCLWQSDGTFISSISLKGVLDYDFSCIVPYDNHSKLFIGDDNGNIVLLRYQPEYLAISDGQ